MNWLTFFVFAFIFLLLIIPVAYWGTKYRAWYAKKILSMTPMQKKRWINFMVNRNFYLAIIGLILFLFILLWDGFVQKGGFLFTFVTIIVYGLIAAYLENKILNR